MLSHGTQIYQKWSKKVNVKINLNLNKCSQQNLISNKIQINICHISTCNRESPAGNISYFFIHAKFILKANSMTFFLPLLYENSKSLNYNTKKNITIEQEECNQFKL